MSWNGRLSCESPCMPANYLIAEHDLNLFWTIALWKSSASEDIWATVQAASVLC